MKEIKSINDIQLCDVVAREQIEFIKENFATKEYTQAMRDEILGVELGDIVTKSHLNSKILDLEEFIRLELVNYASKTSLSNYALKQELANFITIDEYYNLRSTLNTLNNKILELENEIRNLKKGV